MAPGLLEPRNCANALPYFAKEILINLNRLCVSRNEYICLNQDFWIIGLQD
jgi:hypothetical protein